MSPPLPKSPDTQRPFTILRKGPNKSLEEMVNEERANIIELKKQAQIEPKLVSECLATIMAFVKENKDQDGFINGNLAGNNPFIPKKRCPLL